MNDIKIKYCYDCIHIGVCEIIHVLRVFRHFPFCIDNQIAIATICEAYYDNKEITDNK